MALHARIGAALDLPQHVSNVIFVLNGEDGAVRLKGLVKSSDEALSLERAVAQVPGVQRIENHIRWLAGNHAVRASSI